MKSIEELLRIVEFSNDIHAAMEISAPLRERFAKMCDSVVVNLVADTRSGKEAQLTDESINSENVDDYLLDDSARHSLHDRIAASGLEIEHDGEFAVQVRGPAEIIQN